MYLYTSFPPLERKTQKKKVSGDFCQWFTEGFSSYPFGVLIPDTRGIQGLKHLRNKVSSPVFSFRHTSWDKTQVDLVLKKISRGPFHSQSPSDRGYNTGIWRKIVVSRWSTTGINGVSSHLKFWILGVIRYLDRPTTTSINLRVFFIWDLYCT